tara:strand:- start:2749 stop:4512 length:1764 start_codon:yes stop_codon:yes gene_type:complete
MKISKLLNKSYLSILFCFLFVQQTELFSNEPVDIWSLENQKDLEEESLSEVVQDENISEKTLYELQGEKNINSSIELDSQLKSDQIEIVGIYDPSENDITIDMWKNSDGNKILDLYRKIKKIDLSHDSKEILKISLLTNSYVPTKNISNDQFLKLKRDWLLENSDLDLIEKYLIKNQKIKKNEKLIKFLINEYLSKSELEKSCKVLSKINYPSEDEYLTKFNIYCLINNNKKEEAQLQYDLKRELGFKDDFFEKKFNYLMKYDLSIDETVSQESILDFHLSHRTNPNFSFEPNDSTSKKIWRYLSTSNLLTSIDSVDLENEQKILSIEKATHEGNYTEKELFELYKRFQFNINQLLNVNQSYKLLKNVESRALLYQGILINSDINKKLELSKLLKDSFVKDKKGNAFNNELVSILDKIDEKDVPLNYSRFYKKYVQTEKSNLKKIKINNKVIHQSKLINYLKGDLDEDETKKDLNDILKKVKKNKKYFVSIKDIILLETLKSDGIEFDKKYDSLYEVDNSNMPSDLQKLIENEESGLLLLRLVQILGQDNFEDLGPETLLFIVSALNQLNIDKLRNKILLKVLPLKV